MKTTVLFISCEHAVNTIPKEYAHLFDAQKSVLETHRAIDFGAQEVAHHLHQSYSSGFIEAKISRLLIDCNRSIDHPHCFSEFSKPLSDSEKQTLIDKYYLPYRQQAAEWMQTQMDAGNQVLHLSVHSFTPTLNGAVRNAGIGLLYDPLRHGEKEVARLWHGTLLQQIPTYRIRMNYPYRGSSNGFTQALRKQYNEKSYLGFELEMNQTLVKDKESLLELAEALSRSIEELLQLL